MRRITPQEVLDAYNQTKLVPVNSEWGYVATENGMKCGCALTALGTCKTDFDEFLDNVMECECEYVADLLGYDQEYLTGFVDGFDGCFFMGQSDNFRLGAKDGVAAREEVERNIGFRKSPFTIDDLVYGYDDE